MKARGPHIKATNCLKEEQYILTFDDLSQYLVYEYGEKELKALNDGLLTIIRLSDGKELGEDLVWRNLPYTLHTKSK